MHCYALIVAAGRGRRLDPARPKQFIPLAGRPLLAWTIEAFLRCDAIDGVVVVTAADQLHRARELIAEQGWRGGAAGRLTLCAGGEERWRSVHAGLEQLPEQCELVAVHDGARALITPALITRTVEAAARHGAALPALPVDDTIKEIDNSGKEIEDGGRTLPRVARTPARDRLRRAQTPQVFAVTALRQAFARYLALPEASRDPLTDDAQLVERFGEGQPIHLVEGDPANIKLTVPQDLALARSLLHQRLGHAPRGTPPAASLRTGIGYDVHRLEGPAGELVLGGERLPFAKTLAGHSDADVLTHAVGDALLGAAALGDLGQHFPPGDPQWAGASSLGLLERIAKMLADAGWTVSNIDATVVCEQPRISPHASAMRRNLARALGVAEALISVKATTTEGLGFAGRGEGIAAYATALIST